MLESYLSNRKQNVHVHDVMSSMQYITRCTRAYAYFFSEQECDLVTMLVCINLTLLLRKSRRVHNNHDSVSKLLLIAMLTNGHNHWHDVHIFAPFV